MATDFERLRAMKDEDIDCSDIPEFTEEYLNNSEVLWEMPENESIYLNINKNTLNYFKNTGKGYWNRLSILVNDYLKDYVAKQQAQVEFEGLGVRNFYFIFNSRHREQ